MENCILIDWVSITSKIHGTGDLIELLGLDDPGIVWENVKGAHGYRDRLYWNSISIHYNGSDDMGIWLEMSGQGCRAFETYSKHKSFDILFDEVLNNPEEMNITRLDLAFDDHKGLLDINEICEDVEDQSYISKFRGWQVTRSDGGDSVTLGSRSSEVLIRIYDKAAERGFDDGRHWIRVEIQLRRERARAFLAYSSILALRSLGYCGITYGLLRNLIMAILTGGDGR